MAQIKDSYRFRALRSKKSLKYQILAAWDSCQGWVAAALIGFCTAIVAFLVGELQFSTASPDWELTVL